MLIHSFLNHLSHEKRYSPNTIAAYETDLKQFDAYLHQDEESWNEQRLPHATYQDMRAWVIGLIDQGNTPQTINRKIAVLTSYFDFLKAQGLIMENPTQRLLRLKVAKKLPKFIPATEMEKVLDNTVFPIGFEGKRDQLVLELL